MIRSQMLELGKDDLKIPFIEREIYMCPVFIKHEIYFPIEEFIPIITKMLILAKIKEDIVYVTVDQKNIKKGNTHRRGGAHIDENYSCNEWGSPPRWNEIKKNDKSGVLLLSSYPSCKGWIGDYEGIPKEGGDCSDINLDEGFLLKENTIYYGNSNFIHESLPIKEDINRTLIRINIPSTF